MPGADSLEFIELKNISHSEIDLSFLALVKISSGVEITSTPLAQVTLAPDEYYLLGTTIGSGGLPGMGIFVDSNFTSQLG